MNYKFMDHRVVNMIVFAAGAVIGSAVTWKIVKDKYERIAQEEIDIMREAYEEKLCDMQACDCEDEEDIEDGDFHQINWSELEDLDEEELDDEDVNDYQRAINKYTNEKGGATSMAKRPYVISPTDFGEIDEYNQVSLTYYADGVLEDEDWEIVTDVDELIGEDSLNTFGEYEDDSVFVRNEYLSTDFEILKDYRTYAESRMGSPNQVGNE